MHSLAIREGYPSCCRSQRPHLLESGLSFTLKQSAFGDVTILHPSLAKTIWKKAEPFTLSKAGFHPIYACFAIFHIFAFPTFNIIYVSFTIKMGLTNKSPLQGAIKKSVRSIIFNIFAAA